MTRAGQRIGYGLYGLANDIDLTGIDWTPLCNDRNKAFRGKFYGKGYRITGLVVAAPEGSNGAYDNRGLFGCLDGGTLSGVKVSGSVQGSSNVGGRHSGFEESSRSRCSAAVDFACGRSPGLEFPGAGQRGRGDRRDCHGRSDGLVTRTPD